jgi:hypothetical protein
MLPGKIIIGAVNFARQQKSFKANEARPKTVKSVAKNVTGKNNEQKIGKVLDCRSRFSNGLRRRQ